MKWIRTANSNPWWKFNAPMSHQSLLRDGLWVFRGDGEVFGWKERQGGLDWKIPLHENRWNPDEICKSGRLVITIDHNEKADGCDVIAIDPALEKIVWIVKLPVVVKMNGLSCNDTLVFLGVDLIENNKEERGVVALDSATGTVIHQEVIPIGDIVMLQVYREHVFVCNRYNIIVLDLNCQITHSWDNRNRYVVPHGDRVYVNGVVEIEGKKEEVIECLDANTLNETGYFRVTTLYEQGILVPHAFDSPFRLLIVNRDSGHGMAMIDFDSQTVIWKIDQLVTYPFITPHGIIAKLRGINDSIDKSKIVTLDEMTGEILFEFEYRYPMLFGFFWGEDRLVISEETRLESFQWTKDDSATDLVPFIDDDCPFPGGVDPYPEPTEEETEPDEGAVAFDEFIATYYEYIKEQNEEKKKELRNESRILLNKYLKLRPTASIESVAHSLQDLGIAYDLAYKGLFILQQHDE